MTIRIVFFLCASFASIGAVYADEPTGKVLENEANAETKVVVDPLLCGSDDPQAQAAYNAGIDFAAAGNVDEAKRSYHLAIKLDRQYCDAYDNLGRLYRSEGDLKTAIGMYQSSLAIRPNNTVALQNLAVALLLDDDIESAIEVYDKLIGFQPDNPEGPYGLGYLLIQVGRSEEALQYLGQAEKLYLKQGSELVADARVLMALAHADLGACEEARRYRDKVDLGMAPPDIVEAIKARCER